MAKILLENALDTRKLVEKITGLQEGEHFEQCCDYAIANLFQISKFLDVNSHKILRTVEGLRDKFYIHAQSHKAEHFYSLCQDLLKSSVFKDNGTADVPFAVLCLLSELANRPTEAEFMCILEIENTKDYEEKLPSRILEEGAQQFDSFYRARSTSPISNLSDWSSDSDVELSTEYLLEEASEEATISDCDKCNISSVQEIRKAGAISKNGLSGRAWLYQNLEGASWGQTNYNGGEIVQLFGRRFDGPSLFLSERQIIREALWLLEGRKEIRVFEFNSEENTFVVNPKIRTSHLTPDALCALLLPLANDGSIIQMLKHFVEEVTELDVPLNAVSRSQTYKAYASSISQSLCHLTKDVAKLNNLFIEQKQTFTLLMLIENLKVWSRKLNVLNTLHINGVKACHPEWSSATRAAHLLNTLYSTMFELDVLGVICLDKMELILTIFLKSIRPYLNIIDVWITEYSLNDPCQEFIIACNTHAKSLDETFWANAIILRDIPWVKSGTVDVAAVEFLQPVMQMIILIGRSVEVLRHLGALGQIITCDSPSLFSSVINSFTEFFAINDTCGIKVTESDERVVGAQDTSCKPNDQPVYSSSSHQPVGVSAYLDSADIYDSILTGYFNKEYFKRHDKEESHAVIVDGDSKLPDMEEYSNSAFVPIAKNKGKYCLKAVLESGLLFNITAKFEYVSSNLLSVFNDQYQLKESLLALRRYFLMKAGDVMFQFSSQMFDMIPAHGLVQKQAELNLLLEDALANFFPKDVTNLYVDIDKTMVKDDKNAINAYDSVRLVYQISWPLTIIINSTCKQRYDQVFTFLMQVKYAKYRLDELQFRDLQQIPGTLNFREHETKIGKMYLCRMKLLHFVHGIHHYVLTHVLHDTEAMCGEIYGQDSNLERIISANEDYMNAICERCLLHPMVTAIMEAITKILDLALVFNKLWKNFKHIRWEDVHAVEQNLDASCKTIETFVQYITIQKALPYLESLVASCCYSKVYNG